MDSELILSQAGFTHLPDHWGIVSMNDLLSDDRGISVGVMYPGKHDSAGIPLIKAGDLNGSVINPKPEFYITPEKHYEYRRTALEGGELLLTLVGALGQCAVVPNSMAGWNAARAIAVIRLRDSSDTEFVRLCLLSRPLQHLMNVWATTTVQATLNLKEIRELPLPWPPSDERASIVHILGSLDDKIELNRRENATLEAMARAIFKSWFVDFDPVHAKASGEMPSGMDAATAALFPDAFEESALGMIPRGWEIEPLSEVIEINPKRTLRKGQVAPYLSMDKLPTFSARPTEWEYREFGSGMRFINGDVLLARITPCLENGKTAYIDFLEEAQVAWGSTEYIVFRSRPDFPVEYTYFLARSEELRAFAIQNMTGTSGRQRVPASAFEHYPIVVPSPEIAFRFGDIAELFLRQIKANDEQSRTLANLRDTLLPKLISGQLRIGEINDAFTA